jgi:hypothetical protein
MRAAAGSGNSPPPRLLQDMQKKLGVSLPDVPIDVTDVPPEDNLH